MGFAYTTRLRGLLSKGCIVAAVSAYNGRTFLNWK